MRSQICCYGRVLTGNAPAWQDRDKGPAMELIRSWPNKDRAAHYREQAAKLREMAEAETAVAVRQQLLTLANEYTRLVSRLSAET